MIPDPAWASPRRRDVGSATARMSALPREGWRVPLTGVLGDRVAGHRIRALSELMPSGPNRGVAGGDGVGPDVHSNGGRLAVNS